MRNDRVDREMRAVRRLMKQNKEDVNRTDRIALIGLLLTVFFVAAVIFLWWVGVLK